ncbi:hypothetical protein KIW84_075534 [Lathyrus oleraceus]|uniref:Uncharacterized protein n=1 Tax=Pisum sativum TaxID=3888 RepID=A0A9D4VU96_PEA|nr:hypothetical protein KIW84_075534 [Pisum sativum]
MKSKRSYNLLNILEFTSARNRPQWETLLLRKGVITDSVMLELLGKNGREFEELNKYDINKYADSGLRTLILTYCELDGEEYSWKR